MEAQTLSTKDQLAYEARVRLRQAIVAGVAALLLVAAAVVSVIGPQATVSELTVQLLNINKRFPLDLIGAMLQAMGVLALVWTLVFLYDIARARRPEMATATRAIVIVAGIVSAIGTVVYAVLLAVKSHQFATHGTQTYEQAHHLTSSAALPLLSTVNLAAQFGLEICLILIALNAMRVGLLTRFMGYTGMVVGIAGMLLFGSAPAAAVEVFWIGALAYQFAGRWPGEEPPAWRTGRAEPWPTSREIREQKLEAAGKGTRVKPASQPAPQAAGAPAAVPTRTRSATPKRKRKRRH